MGDCDQSFYSILNKRVQNHILQNENKVNLIFGLKAFALIGLWIIVYLEIIQETQTEWILARYMGLGILSSLVIINVCHDAIHKSISKREWINLVFTLPFNLLGASSFFWGRSHELHHNFTNIDRKDKDLEISNLIRLTPTQNFKSIHRYQHIYAFLIYSLATLKTVFVKDYKKLFQEVKNDKCPSGVFIFKFFLSKAAHYSLLLFLPILVNNDNILFHWYLLGYLLYHLVESILLITILQLAHLGEEEALEPNNSGDWAENQLHSTSNYKVNRFFNLVLGGQNQQIEHHLFRNLCHCHYPSISKIIRDTALEYGIRYKESNSMMDAILLHYQFLKRMGRIEGNQSK